MDELSEEDKLTVARARKIQRFLSQPFDVAKVFTGSDGVQVPLEDTISSFKAVVAGEYDHLPEGAFYMVGGIDEVVAKAEGEASRFTSIFLEYKNAKEVTQERMYLETMEKVLADIDKVIIEKNAGSGVVPYLPLPELKKTQVN